MEIAERRKKGRKKKRKEEKEEERRRREEGRGRKREPVIGFSHCRIDTDISCESREKDVLNLFC